MIKYPECIREGDVVGVTATSSSANLSKIDLAINHIKKLGYNIIETSNVRNANIKCVGASADIRAKEFIDLWKNKDVKLIIEARGGEFLMEALPYIHDAFQKEKLYEYSKWVRGYSDITGLLFYLTTWYNIATIEADNVSNYAMNNLHKSLVNSFNFLKMKNDFTQENFALWQKDEFDPEEHNYSFNITEKSDIKTINVDKDKANFSGRLIGGCLDVLSIYRGNKWDNVVNWIEQYKEDGIVWHLENCGNISTEVYRLLWEMREQGWFKYVKGFLIGRTYSGESYEDFTYYDALKKGIGEIGVPIIYDLDIGHQLPQWTLINGSICNVNYMNKKCIIEQKYI